jgi:undecaprenyl-diphosphatase
MSKPTKPLANPSSRRSGGWNPVRWLFDWIGSHELSVNLALLVVVLAVWTFVKIADEVVEGDTMRFDDWAVRTLRRADDPSKPIGPAWLAEVGRDLTALGGVAFLSLLTLAVVGFLWLRKMYGAATLVIVATLGGLVVSSILKWFFERPRPDIVPHLARVYTSSFPSGHSMLSATVFLTLGTLLARFVHERRLKAYFLIVAVVLTMLVGVSRVYLGVHYPTDVLAGWAAGLAWAVACWLVARLLQHRGAVEQEIGDQTDKHRSAAREP